MFLGTSQSLVNFEIIKSIKTQISLVLFHQLLICFKQLKLKKEVLTIIKMQIKC